MITEKVIQSLELDKILHRVAGFVRGDSAKNDAVNLRPTVSFQEAQTRLEETDEADRTLFMHLKSPVSDYDDVNGIMKKAAVGSTLEIKELMAVAKMLRAVRICKLSITEIEGDSLPHLVSRAERMTINKKLEDDISAAILNEEELSDNASVELRTVRHAIARCNTDIKAVLTAIVKSEKYKKSLQDSLVTMRGGRYVVPVKAEYRQNIEGLVHDRSQTNSTFFIEPMQVVELNNKLRSLQLDELAEIERILKAFTDRIMDFRFEMQIDFDMLKELDLIFAKATFSHSIRAVLPDYNCQGVVNLISARHPLIDPNQVVPIDVAIGETFDTLVITGPNTGGKTVSLKTVGLFSLMAMCGLFIPADNRSKLSFFDGVFSDIGDEQSIESSLSTFSSHIRNIKYVCENVTPHSLVLLDEIGAGTDPEEGAALAIGIVDFIALKGAKLITTTHYDKLKEHIAASERAETASMEFDSQLLTPSYRLRMGVTGGSKALEIASLLGLDSVIIENAKQHISPEKVQAARILARADEVISENARLLEENKRMNAEINKKLEDCRLREAELARLTERARVSALKDAKEKIADDVSEADEVLREIKEILKSQSIGTADVVRAGKLKGEIERRLTKLNAETAKPVESIKTYPFDSSKVAVGCQVYVKSLAKCGTVTYAAHKKGEYAVLVGSISMTLKARDLLLTDNQQTEKKPTAIVVNASARSARSEINLLGQTVFDAEQLVASFLDEAASAHLTEVKIIHGMGTGKLRAAVQEMLRANPLVAEYRLGRFGEGESGVTIVTLK